ncbi:FtsW/RodA/SpoVE family cell cycle protein [Solitalea sp. MAHUQ-68]|uniref:Probable peptidoglycan glycosyltransferase FtsW n=1 Tax=Solitalea agri TaxID=2953739 RepID=A0A9X2F1N1_9SPHI|nr:FtsW/RodA/SpoVE family cell cycle protein [Solitalea agri]MCO4292430.1 FtsW/RodA/SpoVE family cell cycle protein [Solitalea agri]
MNWILQQTRGDKWIWLVVFALSMISVLAVYSSTGTLAYKSDVNPFHFLIKHGTMIVAGLAIMYFAHLLDHRYYSRIAQLLLWLSIPLLLYTLFFGSSINNASRWVTLPIINQTFQSSDLAKLALFMYLARSITKRQEKIKDFKEGFLPIFIAVIGVCGLIAPANLSTALMIFGTSMLLLLIGRVSFTQMAMVGIAGAILVAFVVFFGPRRGVYKARVEAFLHPEMVHSDKNYQSDQAKIAIATGGLLGKGPGNSTQRNFLPSPYADFVYAIIIEEYGMMGGLIILALYLVFLYRCVKIVSRSPKAFGALLAAALSFSLVIQAFANMAVATNLFPVTGVALPLVSMGGTSILFTSAAFGIILSISRDLEEAEKKESTTAATV